MRRGRVHRCGCGPTGKNCSFRQKKSPLVHAKNCARCRLKGMGAFAFRSISMLLPNRS